MLNIRVEKELFSQLQMRCIAGEFIVGVRRARYTTLRVVKELNVATGEV